MFGSCKSSQEDRFDFVLRHYYLISALNFYTYNSLKINYCSNLRIHTLVLPSDKVPSEGLITNLIDFEENAMPRSCSRNRNNAEIAENA